LTLYFINLRLKETKLNLINNKTSKSKQERTKQETRKSKEESKCFCFSTKGKEEAKKPNKEEK
jgi:hypothetical protein